MENYSRYVIDLLKQSFSDYIATGEVDAERLTEAQKRLSLEATGAMWVIYHAMNWKPCTGT